MNKGFTFVELLITISIMLIVLLLSFPFYTSLNKRIVLDRTATRLVQDMRKAQELAMSAQEHYDPNTGTDILPDNGYGISIKSGDNKYYIFADYSLATKNNKYDSAKGELVEQVNFEGNIVVQSINAGISNILFLAPDPSVIFANAGGAINTTANEVSIVISDGTRSATIKINRAGLVYIE